MPKIHETGSLNKLTLFLQTVKKTNFFAEDRDDEFQVDLSNGDTLGIFKTWAFPIIPLLEQMSEEQVLMLFNSTHIGNQELEKIEAQWHESISEKPAAYAQALERWRAFSERWDRRLHSVFLDRELPQDPKTRFIELFLRLKVAFAMASSFYNIEAIIVDPRDSFLAALQKGDVSGGVLDLVGMMLPSALEPHVLASQLDWGGLDWGLIGQIVTDLEDDELALVCQIASLAEVDIADVIFAANVLEWIPSNVGGKKGDIPSSEAKREILTLLKNANLTDGHGLVAKNMNALIRFHNWMPLLRSDANFSSASSWQYAAVCDTANEIIALLESEAGILDPEFAKVFILDLLPQLKNLDATSARSRFVLQLVEDKVLMADILQELVDSEPSFIEEVTTQLDDMEENEAVTDLFDTQPRALAGGKAFGIREAANILGEEKVLPGLKITSEAVGNMLRKVGLWDLIVELDNIRDIDSMLEIADTIVSRIEDISFPPHIYEQILNHFSTGLLVVRSSSSDEDTVTSTAAGIYESETKVNIEELEMAIKKVISSFFSEKAITYRCLQGLSHKPMFAIVIQEFLPGRGGIIFTSGNGSDFTLDIGESPEAVASGQSSTIQFSSSLDELDTLPTNLQQIATDALRVEKIMGRRVDMEFVLTNDGNKILQMRHLPEVQNSFLPKNMVTELNDVIISNLSGLDDLELSSETKFRLVLGDSIDIGKFQGSLFRWLLKNKGFIGEIHLSKPIAMTSHFANICEQLGIRITF